MNFENQYLSYEEYQRLGGGILGAPFDLLEYRAEKEIDKPTFNRFRDLDSEKHPMELKICVYELMGTLTKYDNLDTDISSEKVGDYSITRDSKEQREKIKDTSRRTVYNGKT